MKKIASELIRSSERVEGFSQGYGRDRDRARQEETLEAQVASMVRLQEKPRRLRTNKKCSEQRRICLADLKNVVRQ